MSKASKTLSIIFALAFTACTPAFAADKDFDIFWPRFKEALQKNDKLALVSMTQCPFLYRDKQLSKEELLNQIDKVLPLKTRRCLAAQKLTKDNGAYFGFCGDLNYTFSKINGHYMLTDLGAND